MSGAPDRTPSTDHLRTRVNRHADRVTVVLSGDLDRLTGPTVVDVVDRIRERPVRRIDIDLAGVDFLDLGGLRALLRVHHRSSRDGILLVVHNPRHYVRWLLDVTGAAEVLLDAHQAPPAEPALSWINRPAEPADTGNAAYVRLLQDRIVRADDRDRLADEREKLLNERQRRLSDHQQWEDIREDLADQRERDLEQRELDE
jgi:anti-anti-sigma factor